MGGMDEKVDKGGWSRGRKRMGGIDESVGRIVGWTDGEREI
jgi:hypothetical protein